MLEKLVKDDVLHGIKIANSAPMISHLFFADDSIMFSRATREEASHILAIIKSYEEVSGQRINYNKFELSCSQNVLGTRFDELSQLLEVKALESHDRYLGFPTLIGRSKTQLFEFIFDRVWKKLKGWKGRALSQARGGFDQIIGAIHSHICHGMFLDRKSVV